MKKVVVGLSGGVDSSVTAASLHYQGYEVVGLTLWLMKGKGQCCSEGMVDAASLCQQLGIPHHIVDSRDVFTENIIDYLVAGYQAGVTPLPCSQCNRMVKFSPMLKYAKETLGIDYIATGHYARIKYDQETKMYHLLRAVDRHKDQSYFLYDLTQEILAGTLFPLGEQTKEETRKIAAQLNLNTAHKPESQDLCLIESHGSMKEFLNKYIEEKEGEIITEDGKVLGTHQGIHHYTIGQRKGLGIAYSEPLYVTRLDPIKNQVIVGTREQGGRLNCTLERMNWLSIVEPTTPIKAQVQIRYRSQPVLVTVIPLENSRVKLTFDQPQLGITPGQAGVIYSGELLLGGGIIEKE
jgi:tRNA-uridine 2-sulfurtransferase